MTQRREIEATLAELSQRELGPEVALDEHSSLSTIDSVQRLQLAVAVEDHFKICIDAQEERRISTMSDLVLVIERKLRE